MQQPALSALKRLSHEDDEVEEVCWRYGRDVRDCVMAVHKGITVERLGAKAAHVVLAQTIDAYCERWNVISQHIGQ